MKSALIIGASRGIGRQIALTLGRNGYKVGVAAKTLESTPRLPGSIYTVTKEIEEQGGTALPIKCNARVEEDVDGAVQTCIREFGGLDFAVYNAGAVIWANVEHTPVKRFNMLHEVNLRGSYCMIQSVLPHFLKQRSGRILLVSPPIYSRFFRGKAAYAATKIGMTVIMTGLSMELQGTGVSVSSMWPATPLGSFVMEKLSVPPPLYRSPQIFADAAMIIAEEPTEKYNGQALIDEDLLRSTGVTDFKHYRADPDHEPRRIMPRGFPSLKVDEEDQPPIFGGVFSENKSQL